MNNSIRLHFGSTTSIDAKQIGRPEDSGNGYYSYSYYLLPYTGDLTPSALQAVHSHLFKRHYNPPFTSLNCVERFGRSADSGGILLVGTTYHHGD